jgi:peptidoglycan biosynthesis protein MviN/MurJ (putative lipid II flippase)
MCNVPHNIITITIPNHTCIHYNTYIECVHRYTFVELRRGIASSSLSIVIALCSVVFIWICSKEINTPHLTVSHIVSSWYIHISMYLRRGEKKTAEDEWKMKDLLLLLLMLTVSVYTLPLTTCDYSLTGTVRTYIHCTCLPSINDIWVICRMELKG